MSTKQTPEEVEEVKDLEQVEEVQDLTEIEKVEDLKEVPEEVKEAAPVLKSGGLRGISTPSMIHTHLDNFLAAIAGETPVNDDVRNSAEYWLNQIAEKYKNMNYTSIWENTDGTAFAPQTVLLDLSEYRFILIFYGITVTSSSGYRETSSLLEVNGKKTELNIFDSGTMATRAATVSSTGIVFEDGKSIAITDGTITTNNSRCIPVRIYGIK